MRERIRAAMDRFEVPYGRETFLFSLPALYVAKADGKISIREMKSVAWYSLTLGLVDAKTDEKLVFETFIKNKMNMFQGKSNLSDFVVLADAIDDLLDTYGPSEARKIRQAMHQACTKAAKASGPTSGDRVSGPEREMLGRIFARL